MDRRKSWQRKYAVAFRGLWISIHDQRSFGIHLSIAAMVLILAATMRLEAWRWAALVCVITLVFSAELMNTAIERLVKRLHPEHDSQIGDALDTAAAAVLVAAIGAVFAGVIVLGPPLLEWVLLGS
ncbi:Undecaprenol kinase [Novipirellula aureliae]|uniref:Undecaprenol kinase n=1 Tax=Novipirellula aureliae TaxID=2527966 RepID=A0A5C6DVG9_9BACT|nr:diacylglycerol kinase [Novipirellula aureliae]TWU41373.1 Undecaprenol kinase [Novipirellula aureliae]